MEETGVPRENHRPVSLDYKFFFMEETGVPRENHRPVSLDYK
jgi:hypothetical protein